MVGFVLSTERMCAEPKCPVRPSRQWGRMGG